MIIRYPTALYATVIPSAPEVAGNVTFTISNSQPPRTTRTTIIIPPAIELKGWPEVLIDQSQRRRFLGDQVFTVAKSSTYTATSGMKQHEVGEVLEFSDEVDSGLQPMVVADDTEIRHDTNVLDYGDIGLSEDEVAAINRASEVAYFAIITQLNTVRGDRSKSEADINHNQKQQNEVLKVLSAITSIGDSTTTSEIKSKLELRLTELQDEQAQFIAIANDLADQAATLSDRLRSVSQVVR